MTTHPTIAALKAALESERVELIDAYLHKQCVEMNVTRNEMDNSLVGYRNGHEAATERLMGLIKKAVKMANEISAKANMTIYNHSEEFMDGANAANIQCAEIAKEFLTTLADAGVIKKDLGDGK